MTEGNVHRFDRRLVCVKYPGIVTDEQRMIKTLGGIQNISNTFSVKNRRLDLHFRPEDPHSKAVYADQEKVAGLLLRVRVPRNKPSATQEGEGSSSDCSYTVLGRVTETFTFKSLCDFQYLPQTSGSAQEPQECTIEKIFPSSSVPRMTWLNEPNDQLFLLPATLSRMDTPNTYCYRNDNIDPASTDQSGIGKSARMSRKNHTQRLTFDDKQQVPTKPLSAAVKEMKARKLPVSLLQKIKDMFERRPVWSKVALQMECDVYNLNAIRYLLPCVAYYYMSGPWRLLWVRHGYDPRAHPEARYYQLLDYRVQSIRLRTLVKARNRTRNIQMPHKHQKNSKGVRRNYITKEALQNVRSQDVTMKEDLEPFYKFRVGMIPAHRNMLYQFIDLDVKEIKELLKVLPPTGAVCHERNGWLPAETFDIVRKIIDDKATSAAVTVYGQEEAEPAEESGPSSDSDDSSLVILSSSEGESDPEPELEVDDDSN